jgi:hypothetical protein
VTKCQKWRESGLIGDVDFIIGWLVAVVFSHAQNNVLLSHVVRSKYIILYFYSRLRLSWHVMYVFEL